MLNTRGMRFPIEVILVSIGWCTAYSLSYRHLEEMMQERGVVVDHSSINRWAIRFLPLLEKVFGNHTHGLVKADGWIKRNQGERRLEISISSGRQARQDRRFPVERQTGWIRAKLYFDKAMRYSEVPGTVKMTRAAPIRPCLTSPTSNEKSLTISGKSNTSTISSSRITVPSNASPRQCAASNRFPLRKQC